MAVWGLNLQFGVAGIVNFAFIIFQAAGAYTAAVLTLGPASSQPASSSTSAAPAALPAADARRRAGRRPAGGAGRPGSPCAGCAADYQAMVMLVVSLIATYVVDNEIASGQRSGRPVPGAQAAVGWPRPVAVGYQWFYVGLTAVICVLIYLFVRRFTGSPLGPRAARGPRQRAGGGGAGQERLRAADARLRRRRRDRRHQRRRARRVHRRLVSRLVALPGDVRVLHRRHRRRHRQQRRRRRSARCSCPIGFLERPGSCPTSASPGSSTRCSGSPSACSPSSSCGSGPAGVIPERQRRFPRAGEERRRLGALPCARCADDLPSSCSPSRPASAASAACALSTACPSSVPPRARSPA